MDNYKRSSVTENIVRHMVDQKGVQAGVVDRPRWTSAIGGWRLYWDYPPVPGAFLMFSYTKKSGGGYRVSAYWNHEVLYKSSTLYHNINFEPDPWGAIQIDGWTRSDIEQHMDSAVQALQRQRLPREDIRDSLVQAGQQACGYMNCKLFVQTVTGIPKLDDLPTRPFVSETDLVPGDVLKWGMGTHWAIYIGDGDIMEVEEWGAESRIIPLAEVLEEMNPPDMVFSTAGPKSAPASGPDPSMDPLSVTALPPVPPAPAPPAPAPPAPAPPAPLPSRAFSEGGGAAIPILGLGLLLALMLQ